MKIGIFLSLVFTLWVLPGEAAPQVYRYMDKDGVVHFTDTPTDKNFSSYDVSWRQNKADDPEEISEAEGDNGQIAQNQEDVLLSAGGLPQIEFSSPPNVIPIPETNAYFVPDLPLDLFFSDGWWWLPWGGRWYRSQHYNSGWVYYKSVPSFHGRIPSGWRDDYKNRQWRGHQWNYQQISHQQLQVNWKNWKESRYWEKPQTWSVQGSKPLPQQPSWRVQYHRPQSQPVPQQAPHQVQYQQPQPVPQQASGQVQYQHSRPVPQQPSGRVQYQQPQPVPQHPPQPVQYHHPQQNPLPQQPPRQVQYQQPQPQPVPQQPSWQFQYRRP